MRKTLFGLFGLLIFITSLGLGINIVQSTKKASELDSEKTVYGMISDDAPPPCVWEVTPPENVMNENKTQALLISTKNEAEKPCESTISLRAPGFDTNPSKEEQKVSIPVGGSGSISWIVIARKAGTYEITVSDILNTKIFGITVTNMFGLSAGQSKVVSIIGSLFGPMFTIPWWWEKLSKRKQKE